jgi:uncharacterized membrane protein (DUF106 family)
MIAFPLTIRAEITPTMIIFHMLSSSAAQNNEIRKYIYRLELNCESNMFHAWLTLYNWTEAVRQDCTKTMGWNCLGDIKISTIIW